MMEYAKWQQHCDQVILSRTSSDGDIEGERKRCIQEQFIFNDASVRNKFMRKVYLILMGQLVITLAILTIFSFNTTVQMFVVQNPIVFWISFPFLIVTMLLMMCFEELRRSFPINIIFLTIFTVVESVVLAVLVIQYQIHDVLMAVAITSVVCFTLSIYATQTRYDFTTWGAILLVVTVSLIISSILIIFYPSHLLIMVHSTLGAIIFAVYLVYDTQLMMGGNHMYAINPEEYIFAVLNLYLDIVNLFIHLLPLAASRG